MYPIYRGEQTRSFGARDPQLNAYLNYLKDNPDKMKAVGERLQDELDHPPVAQFDKKSSILRLLVRLGIQEGLPDEAELLSDAAAEYGRRNP